MKTRSRAKPAPRPQPTPGFSTQPVAGIAPARSRPLTIGALVLAALFAGGLLYMITGPHRIGDYMTETDFYGDYARGAQLIQHGRLLPSRYGVVGPGYELALALAGVVIRDLFLAAQLLSLASMTGALLLWFFVLRRRANAALALVAALVLATNPHFFHYGYAATTDAFAIVLQAASLALLLTGSRTRTLAAAGVVAALAFLTRYNALVLLPAGVLVILAGGTLAAAPADEPAPLARRARLALLYAGAFFAPVVPWVLYSLTHGGSMSFQLHHNIAYEVFARAKGIPWDTYQRDLQPQFKTLWDVIRKDPPAVFSRMAFNCVDHLRLDAASLLGWPVAVTALLGIGLGVRDGSLRRLWPLWLAWGLFFVALVPAFHSVRYSLALLPFYATAIGIAVASPIGVLVAGGARHVWLKPVLALVPLGFSVAELTRVQAQVIDQLPTEVLECAETLRQLKRPGDRLIARKWHVAFHAGVEAVAFPFADSLDGLGDYAHRHGVRWLYISWPEVETRPQFFYLLDTTSAVPGLTVRRATAPHPAVLYEIGPRFGERPRWFGNDTLRALHTVRARLMVEGNNVHLMTALATIERALGDLGAARHAADRAVAFAPNDVEALKTLGATALHQGDGQTALSALERASALDPRDLEAPIGIGWALLALGRGPEAAAHWRPLISTTDDPGTLMQMLKLYHASGDREAEQRVIAVLQRTGSTP